MSILAKVSGLIADAAAVAPAASDEKRPPLDPENAVEKAVIAEDILGNANSNTVEKFLIPSTNPTSFKTDICAVGFLWYNKNKKGDLLWR